MPKTNMIIDVHTHIFPDVIKNNRSHFFPGETPFELLYASKKSNMITGAELVSAMDENGVDLSVTFGFPWKNIDLSRQHNNYVMNQVKRYPNRLKGFCCVDIFSAGAVEEVERCLDQGMSGVGELAIYENGIDETALKQMTPIFDMCRERNLPVMMHVNEPVGHMYPGKAPITMAQIYNMIKRFPDNKIVLAHWGGGMFFFSLLKKEVKDLLKNVYFDTAASPYLYDKEIYAIACQLVGEEKVLFGSDYPLLKPQRYFKEMQDSKLEKTLLDAVCGKSAEHFLLSGDSLLDEN